MSRKKVEKSVRLVTKSNKLIEARHDFDIWELRIFTKMLMLIGEKDVHLDYIIPIKDIIADFELSVPELLLKQQQRTKDIFNIVLGVIAGISLLVGGIGIMNIMLASVLERIKEIGIRLSMGATKDDIVQQFLFEAVLISVSGGVAGIILGVSLSFIIGQVAAIQTIISVWSIVISFGVAALTGLVFGITPAKRAAQLDPIQSLRYE